jgi:4-amino-4-deoxy-L-arabinose transferase-like glycosyltransferase
MRTKTASTGWLGSPNLQHSQVDERKSNLLLLWQKLVLVGILGIAIWLPRGLVLDRFVTVDEPSWLTFSGNFYQALAHGDFVKTYQIEHPGVTTMWAGTAALVWLYPEYAYDAPGQINWVEQEIGPFLHEHGHHPVKVLAAARSVVVLAITIVLLLAAVAAARLLGFWAALAGFLLIASDPLHLALSRVLHVDALMSSLILLSLLAFLNYLYRGRQRLDLAISAVAAGMAWLTKAPAFFLIPFVGLLMLIELGSKWRSRQQLMMADIWRVVWSLVAWGAVGLAVFVLFWPAMWVDPINSLRAIAREAIGYARSGHEAPLFFNGAIVQGDPGALFYPITFLWRTTPVVLVGLALAAVSFITPRLRPDQPSNRHIVAMLVLFAAFFTLLMSLGAKKFDRYLLPVYAPLDLVAAIGWVAAAGWLKGRLGALRRAGAPALVGLAIAVQAASVLPAFPYYFSYYNPLLGGTAKAPQVMMIGWGEGLDQAARYLNSLPNPEQLRVTTWFWNGTFSYFFKGQSLPGKFTPDTASVLQWTSSDYSVIYVNQRQRGRLPAELLDYVERLQPVMVVRIQGLEYAWIYDIRNVPIPDYLLGKSARSTER